MKNECRFNTFFLLPIFRFCFCFCFSSLLSFCMAGERKYVMGDIKSPQFTFSLLFLRLIYFVGWFAH